MPDENDSKDRKKGRLRCGFSTGTAACAAAVAALRYILTDSVPDVVAVRLPSGVYLPIPIAECGSEGGVARACVIKDGGDDPDVTNRVKIWAAVRIVRNEHGANGTSPSAGYAVPVQRGPDSSHCGKDGILLIAGEGVGTATKPGLPVAPGEPAINPVPRQMFSENLPREFASFERDFIRERALEPGDERSRPFVFLPFSVLDRGRLSDISLEITISIPGGESLARHTLNPRLGIAGGLSILGTTGIVRPFSHEAYEETIRAAMGVAACNGCKGVVLSTGGKSERFARGMLPDEPVESFVQIADFFSFSVHEARRFGFNWIVHSVFFGKAVKMAHGHDYTHAHSATLDLALVAKIAQESGYDPEFCREIAEANTARHALEIIEGRGAFEIVHKVAALALRSSAALTGCAMDIRLLLFNFDGGLLADLNHNGKA